MFSAPFRAVFYVLAQAFMKLYNMPADWTIADEHSEFTGADMMSRPIAHEDNPAAGSGPDAPIVVNTPAEVFNSGADVKQVFANVSGGAGDEYLNGIGANLSAAQAAAVAHVPDYRIVTAMAGPYTREQFHAQGWTDEMLLKHGYMEDVAPKPVAPSIAAVPAPPTAPTAPAPTLPPTAPAASLPAQPPAAGAPIAAPASASPVMLDSEGLPWDARIHSGGRTRTAKDVWVKRKNVPDSTVAAVVAELRQKAPPAAFVPLAPSTPPVVLAPVAPPAGDGPVPTTFIDLMKWAGDNKLGHLFPATGAAMGLVSFGLLAHETNPEVIAKAYNVMQSLRA